ncbi:hypothetical protein FEP45_03902 [Burkholderia multivorans]|nr:hypothetical protein [Burkholderia multivorans]
MKMNGTIMQPTKNGTRQPHAAMSAALSQRFSAKPSAAATTIATCWLADCQLVKKPLRPGVAISAR